MVALARPLRSSVALTCLALAGCNLAVATGRITAWEGDPAATSGAGAGATATGGAAGTGGAATTGSTTGEGAGGGVLQPPPPPTGPTAYHAEFRLRVRPASGTVSVEPGAMSVVPDDLFTGAEIAPPGTFVLTAAALGADKACPAGAQSSSLCFDVTVEHTLSRSVANVFAQVLEVLPAGGSGPAPTTGPLNPDPTEFGLDATRGLWKYTAPAAATSGVLGQAPDAAGTRRWAVSTEAHGDVDLLVRVVANLGYSTYSEDFSDQGFVDACLEGTSLGQPDFAAQALPFPFALYGATLSSVFLDARGVLSLGESAPLVMSSSLALPSPSAPRASVFAFWDDLRYADDESALCVSAAGEAPNRRFFVTWKKMDFAPGPDAGAALTFTAVLAEGSNRVDLIYGEMTGPTARAHGTSAVMGVQNEAGDAAAAEMFPSALSSGAAFSFLPLP
jgi:hypothetical protein